MRVAIRKFHFLKRQKRDWYNDSVYGSGVYGAGTYAGGGTAYWDGYGVNSGRRMNDGTTPPFADSMREAGGFYAKRRSPEMPEYAFLLEKLSTPQRGDFQSGLPHAKTLPQSLPPP